jgi:hypothetical protein
MLAVAAVFIESEKNVDISLGKIKAVERSYY